MGKKGRTLMPRILVVDDTPLYLQAACELLEDLGHEAVGFGTVQEALDNAPSGFRMILTDYEMPGGGGERILREKPNIPAIVMSGRLNNPGDDYQQLLLNLGAVATVRKSFLSEDLVPALATVLADSQSPLKVGDQIVANCYKCLVQLTVTLGEEKPLWPGFCSPQHSIGRMKWTEQAIGTSFDLWEKKGGSGHKTCPVCHRTYAHVIAIYDPTHGPQVFLYESEGA